MTDAVVRMHLVQALTRTEQSAVRTHLRASLDHWDTSTNSHDESSGSGPLTHIERAERTLETWLVTHADAGVPKLILIEILCEYAIRVAELGHIPRSWGTTTNVHVTSATKPRSDQHSPRTDHQRGQRR